MAIVLVLEDILFCSKLSFLDKKISMEIIEKKAQAVMDTSCAFCLGFKHA
ncbi:hypothetical protein J2Z42_002015 [Clostridium algifaecis]|uniref:Uncharacterized protein n=1 Tax=Clostridium algifaecis TaxID=1472040 RepID=A0ABS4KTF0_9CLOT|nr:hypothetical protein [Clostridium algifaecis]MBP2033312.1 hypothetical protein [Clostridium algifaecis]